MEVNRTGLSAGNRPLHSLTELQPAHRVFTHAYTNPTQLHTPQSCHGEARQSWVAGDKGWGELGREERTSQEDSQSKGIYSTPLESTVCWLCVCWGNNTVRLCVYAGGIIITGVCIYIVCSRGKWQSSIGISSHAAVSLSLFDSRSLKTYGYTH